ETGLKLASELIQIDSATRALNDLKKSSSDLAMTNGSSAKSNKKTIE
ncbi:3565_t:CDS:1, partial [Dentiscutata heterogama]